MRTVVITGSTRGIGHGMADSFLASGCEVAVSGRTQPAVDRVVACLKEKYPDRDVMGWVCDVRKLDDVQGLWEAASKHFGKIDIWINNAGISNRISGFDELDPFEIDAVVNTNILGSLYGARVALRGFRAQGFGAIYNLEGLGSDGKRKVKGLTLYGMTKAALRYLDDALMKEVEDTPIIVSALQPGMVVTDMITTQYLHRQDDFQKVRGILNLLSERVEVVAPWMVKRILTNKKNGARISYMNSGRMLGRLLCLPFIKRDVLK